MSNIKNMMFARIEKLVSELTYEEYCERYSKASHKEEISRIKLLLNEHAELCRQFGWKLPKTEYTGHFGIRVDMNLKFGFECDENYVYDPHAHPLG